MRKLLACIFLTFLATQGIAKRSKQVLNQSDVKLLMSRADTLGPDSTDKRHLGSDSKRWLRVRGIYGVFDTSLVDTGGGVLIPAWAAYLNTWRNDTGCGNYWFKQNIYAGMMYDYNNNAYYVNPAVLSKLNQLDITDSLHALKFYLTRRANMKFATGDYDNLWSIMNTDLYGGLVSPRTLDGTWEGNAVFDMHYAEKDDTLFAYYVGADSTDTCRIGRKYSLDNGFSWIADANNPLISPNLDSFEIALWEGPIEYDTTASQWNFWMQCKDSVNRYNTKWLSSSDGISWTRRNNNLPVLYNQGWDVGYAGARNVIRRNDSLFMLYEGQYASSQMQAGLAIGVNESTFVKVDTLAPVLTVIGTSDTLWAGNSIIPTMIGWGDMFIMWYGANNAHSNLEGIGMAFSSNGSDWTKYAGNPVANMQELFSDNSALIDMYFNGQDLLGSFRWGNLGGGLLTGKISQVSQFASECGRAMIATNADTCGYSQSQWDSLGLFLRLAGGTMSGDIDMGDNNITNVEKAEIDTVWLFNDVGIIKLESATEPGYGTEIKFQYGGGNDTFEIIQGGNRLIKSTHSASVLVELGNPSLDTTRIYGAEVKIPGKVLIEDTVKAPVFEGKLFGKADSAGYADTAGWASGGSVDTANYAYNVPCDSIKNCPVDSSDVSAQAWESYNADTSDTCGAVFSNLQYPNALLRNGSRELTGDWNTGVKDIIVGGTSPGAYGAGRIRALNAGQDVKGFTIGDNTRLWDFVAISSSNPDRFAIRDFTAGINRFIIDEDGDVGIGDNVANPSEKLEVKGRICLTTDPNSGDDVMDRDYADARYINNDVDDTISANLWVDTLWYNSTMTRYFSIHCLSGFNPHVSTVAWQVAGSGIWETAGNSAEFYAPLNLPNGATMTELRTWVTDNDSTTNMLFDLYRVELGVSGGRIATTCSSGDSAGVQELYDNTITTPVIDNENYAYYFNIECAGANLKAIAARITYTITRPDP